MHILSTHGAYQRILTTLLIEANKVQFLTLVSFDMGALSILDSVLGFGRLYHHQLFDCKDLYIFNQFCLFLSSQQHQQLIKYFIFEAYIHYHQFSSAFFFYFEIPHIKQYQFILSTLLTNLLYNRQFNQNQQMAEYKNTKLESLQPRRLTQSIKSRPDYDKNESNQLNQVQQDHARKNMYYTQDVYEIIQEKVNDGNGFKKTKGNTVQKLNELKRQYELLRNIKIDDSFIYSEKKQKRMGSSVDFSEKSMRSHKSIQNNSKVKNIPNNQNQTLLEYEKKQLETMLANSMNKIQQLLRAQVDYKKRIHDLSKNPVQNEQNPEHEETINNLKKNQKAYHQKLEILRNENDKLRKLNFNLTERIRSLESENFNLETESRRANQQKRRLQQFLLLQKQGGMNAKIEVRRFQLQKDMIEREKVSEVQRFKKTIKDLIAEREKESQALNEKLRLKDQEIMQLTDKMHEYQKLPSKPKKIQESHQKTKPKQSSQNNLQKRIAQKLKQLQNNTQQEKIKNQIQNLKSQIDQMMSIDEGNDQKLGLEQRIRALEQVINQDNEQKMKFLDQLNKMVRDYHQLENQNSQLKNRLRNAERQHDLLKQSTSYHIQKLQKSRRQLNVDTYSEQIQNYLAKLRRLQAQNKQLKTKLSKVQDSISNSQSKAEEKIRQYSRRMEEAELEIEKLLKQNQFNLQMANAKYRAQIQLTKNNYALISREKQDQRGKFESMKKILENKFESLRRQHEQLLLSHNQIVQEKDEQIQQIRRASQQSNNRTRQEYEQELFLLLNRLNELIKTNERYAIENSNLINTSGQLYELRNKIRRMSGYNEGLDHLWQIKQAEYCNLNELLKQLRAQ